MAANLPVYAINFVLDRAGGLWALRYPHTHPLYLLEREPGEPLAHASSLGTPCTPRRAPSAPLVVLASERMDIDPGWRLLAPGGLLHVDTPPASSR